MPEFRARLGGIAGRRPGPSALAAVRLRMRGIRSLGCGGPLSDSIFSFNVVFVFLRSSEFRKGNQKRKYYLFN